MIVVMNTSWAGLHFSFAPGDLVQMPDALARERLGLGHVREPIADELTTLDLLPFPGMPKPEPMTSSPPRRRSKEKPNARPRQ